MNAGCGAGRQFSLQAWFGGGSAHLFLGLLGAAALGGCVGSPGESAACSNCRLVLESDVRLMPDSVDVGFTVLTRVVRTRSGNIFAAPLVKASTFAIFSPAGELIRVYDRAGEGPGELTAIEGAHASGDTLYVIESDGDVEIFDSDGNWIRSLRLNVRSRGVWSLPDASLLVLGLGTNGPLYRFDRTRSELLRVDSEADREEAPRGRVVALDAHGRVWTALSSYRFETYRLESFAPLDSAMERWDVSIEPLLGERLFREPEYVARALGIAAHGEDSVLVLLARQPRSPPRAMPSGGGDPTQRALGVEDVGERYDHYLDLLDPRDRRLSGRWRLEGRVIGGFVDPQSVFSIEAADELDPFIQVWRIRIQEGDEESM